jgi:hypothetical protein
MRGIELDSVAVTVSVRLEVRDNVFKVVLHASDEERDTLPVKADSVPAEVKVSVNDSV